MGGWCESGNWVVVMTDSSDVIETYDATASQRSFLRYALHMAATAQSEAVQRVFRLYAAQQQALLDHPPEKRARRTRA